jgi:hypothetical protein
MARIMTPRAAIVPQKLRLAWDGTLAGRSRSHTDIAAGASNSTIVHMLTLFRHFATAHSVPSSRTISLASVHRAGTLIRHGRFDEAWQRRLE